MATNRPLSYHHYYQIISKFRSKSSDSLSNTKSAKQVNKPTKMKKSQTIYSDFESKSPQITSALRRRFSFFRLKRSSQSNIQGLQQIIDQLKCDLQMKTDELEAMKEHHLIQPSSNQSIEQAMQLQTTLNAKLEEMLTENDLLKKSIEELESFVQQQKSKSKRKKSLVLSMINVCSYPLVIHTSGIAQ